MRKVGLHPSDSSRRRAAAQFAQTVDARRQQGRRPARDGLLRVLYARRRRRVSGVGDQRQGLGRFARRDRRAAAGAEPETRSSAARRRDRATERRQVVVRQPAARRGSARRVGDRGHDARRDRHADALSRPAVHFRRHGGSAAPEQDRRRHRVLLVAAHAARDRARRHLHSHGRCDRRRDPEPGSQDRRARVGSGPRADPRRQQVGSRGEGRQSDRQVSRRPPARRRRSSSSCRFCSRRRSPASA